MFKIRKKLIGVMMAVAVASLSIPMELFAAGTTTIRVSDSDPSVGDGVSVNVIASESDSVSVKYNPEVLQLTGGSMEYTTDGNTITFTGTDATFQFKAVASGKSSIIVSGANVTGSSTSIQVGEGAATSSDAEQPTAQNNSSEQEGQFTIDGVGYVVSERFSEEEIPAGFERVRVTIDGYNYKALSNGSLTLIYLKPASDTSSKGTFYVYNQDANSVSTFAILGKGDNFILLSKTERMPVEGMQEAEITVDDRKVKVYTIGDAQEFVYAYGTNPQGESGWYQYDTKDGSLQRMNLQLLGVSAGTEDVEPIAANQDSYYEKWSKQRYLLAGLLFVVVVLLVLVINLLLSRRRVVEDDEVWDDDDSEDAEGVLSFEDESVEDDPLTEDVQKFINQVSDTKLDAQGEELEEEPAEAPEENTKEVTPSEELVDEIIYNDMKRTEAFRSSKETRHKSSADDQIDILDLNDL